MSKRTLRQSMVKDFLGCGLYFEKKYLQKLPTRPTPVMTIGSACDGAFNHALRAKMEGRTVTLEEAQDVVSSELDGRKEETLWDEDNTADKAKDTSMKIVKVFLDKVAPTIQPVAVQETFKLETPEYFVEGTIDYREANGMIGDAKTCSNQTVNNYQVNARMQPALYTWGIEHYTGVKPTGFRLDRITRGTKTMAPEYKPIQGQVSSVDVEFCFLAFNRVNKMIDAGVFLPADESSFKCNGKSCPFWDQCKGRKA